MDHPRGGDTILHGSAGHEKRIFKVRNTIFTTWQSAVVSAPNSSVRSLTARHRVAMTFDVDEAVAKVRAELATQPHQRRCFRDISGCSALRILKCFESLRGNRNSPSVSSLIRHATSRLIDSLRLY